MPGRSIIWFVRDWLAIGWYMVRDSARAHDARGMSDDHPGGSTPTRPDPERTVDEVISIADLPPGSMGSRRAIVRWSDGEEAEACRWYADELLVCEGDLVGKTAAEIRRVLLEREKDFLARS